MTSYYCVPRGRDVPFRHELNQHGLRSGVRFERDGVIWEVEHDPVFVAEYKRDSSEPGHLSVKRVGDTGSVS